MKYDVYICYSMNFSDLAYDLSAKLGRERVMCHLDCVDSGFTLNDYVKRMMDSCRTYVALVGSRFATSSYALASLNYAIETGKAVTACYMDGTPLPEELAAQVHIVARESLLSEVLFKAKSNEPPMPIEPAASVTPEEPEAISAEKAEAIAELVASLPNYSTPTILPEQPYTYEEPKAEASTQPVVEEEENTSFSSWRMAIGIILMIIISPTIRLYKTVMQEKPSTQVVALPQLTVEQADEAKRLYYLGRAYFYGDGDVKINRVKGLELIERAAEMGNLQAIYNAGVICKMTCRAELSEELRTKAAHYLYKATAYGHEQSFEKLSEMCYWGADFHEAKRLLAHCYERGYGTKKNADNMVYWYNESAKNGNVEALCKMGDLYFYGKGVKKDFKNAQLYYERAAKMGNARAKQMLQEIK